MCLQDSFRFHLEAARSSYRIYKELIRAHETEAAKEELRQCNIHKNRCLLLVDNSTEVRALLDILNKESK